MGEPFVIVVHPSRLKDTAAWIVANLEPEDYPAIDHHPDDETSRPHQLQRWEWEDLSYFDHHDTTKDGDGRTPRRHHLIFHNEQAWMLLKILQ